MKTAFLLQHLLASAAASAPQRLAAATGSSSLSYAELDDRSSRLATVLRANGVRPGDRVGLHVAKSVEAIVAIYGILKSGAAYIPLDPAAPASPSHTSSRTRHALSRQRGSCARGCTDGDASHCLF